MDDKKVNNFLQNIGQIESANGKYTNHKQLDHGMHKGTSAYGTYGLMPLTISELAGSSNNPEVQALRGMSETEMKAELGKNPALEQALARQLAEKVLNNQQGDEQKAAYAWYNGHNLSPGKIESRDYINSDYVRKYSKLGSLISNKVASSPVSVEGTPSESKVLDYLGAAPGGGTAATLALNTSQRSDMDKMLEGIGRSPASTTIPESGYSSLLTKAIPQQEEQELAQPVHKQTPIDIAKPNFGAINKLIASYNKGKK